MRYGKTEIHPAVWEPIHDSAESFDRGVRIGEQKALFAGDRQEWWKVYGAELRLKLAVPAALAVFSLVCFATVGPRDDIVGTFALVIGFFWAWAVWYDLGGNAEDYSAATLRTLVNASNPDTITTAYISSITRVGESATLSEVGRQEAISELHSLVDESIRLGALERKFSLVANSAATIDHEILLIHTQFANAPDEDTRQALHQSLAIAHRRRSQADGQTNLARRIEAEQMLLRQLIMQVGESVGQTSHPTLDFSEIRKRLASITNRVDETERARAELDAA